MMFRTGVRRVSSSLSQFFPHIRFFKWAENCHNKVHHLNNGEPHTFVRAGLRSRYRDWLRAGRSGDRIPVGARYSALIHTALGPTQPSVQSVPGLSWGKGRPERDADPSPLSSAVVMKG